MRQLVAEPQEKRVRDGSSKEIYLADFHIFQEHHIDHVLDLPLGEEEESDDSDQTQNWVTENDKMRGPGNNINDEDENENEDIIDAINKTRAEEDIDQQNEGDIQVINVDEYGRL